MNICILADRIPPESNGGAERVAWQSAVALAQRRHDVSLITTTKRPIVGMEEEMREGVRVFTMHSQYAERWRSWRSLYNPTCIPNVRNILREVKPDVVHAHNIHYHLSYAALRVAKQSGAKVFLTSHDVMPFHYGKLVEFIDPRNPICKANWDYRVSARQKIKRFKRWYNPFRNSVIRFYLKRLDGFFAVSDALREALFQNGMPQASVLHTGIDIDSWNVSQPVVEAFQDKFKLRGRKVIFFGGRLTGAKGGAQLLQALARTVPKAPSVLLLIASTPDAYLGQLKSEARDLGIANNIQSTGWLSGDELKAAYHSAALVAVPSVCFDSFPLTNLEAMACRKPVIATCFGGSRESVADGETGYIINPYDIDTFAECLIDLLSDDGERTQFGQRGYERVKSKFSIECHIDLLEKYYGSPNNT